MLSRSSAIIPFARKALRANVPAISAVPMRLDHHGPPANYKWPTMDDMLIPCGSWQENYDNNQRRYNIHLLFGAGFFAVTLMVGIVSGALDLHTSFPKRPAPKRNSD